jgi:hypothetical protein
MAAIGVAPQELFTTQCDRGSLNPSAKLSVFGNGEMRDGAEKKAGKSACPNEILIATHQK